MQLVSIVKAGVHKSWVPGQHGSCILYGGA